MWIIVTDFMNLCKVVNENLAKLLHFLFHHRHNNVAITIHIFILFKQFLARSALLIYLKIFLDQKLNLSKVVEIKDLSNL